MADAAAAAAAAAAARNNPLELLARQPKYVPYPDYKTSDDFTTWLAGYVVRVRNANGFKMEERDKLQREVLRTIAGKLSVGTALDAYDRMSDAEKQDYNRMVAKLTEEFTNPREKKRFNDNMSYNKRKKGQTIREYMQDIKNDINRYSDLPATVFRVDGGIVPNPEREKQGVRRFIKGIRDEDGKRDSNFKKNVKADLYKTKNYTWENAFDAAMRFEAASDSEEEEGDSSDSDSDSDEEVEAVEQKKKKGKRKAKGKKTVGALADQVHENQMRLTKVETAQERMATTQDQFSSALGSQNATLQEISAKLDLTLAHMGGNNSQPFQPRQQQYRFQPRSQQQQVQLQQQQKARPAQPFRPQTYTYQPRNGTPFKANPAQNTWQAKNNQARQGSFGFNRKTPSSFPTATAPASTVPKTVAAVEEVDSNAQELFDEEVEESVSVPMSHFMALTNQAGVEVQEEDMIAAVADLNFC